MGEVFGEVIHSYTRAQAIADGELVDVTVMARLIRPDIPNVVVTPGVLADADEIAGRTPCPGLDRPTRCAAVAGVIAAGGWGLLQSSEDTQKELAEFGSVRADFASTRDGATKTYSIHYGPADDATPVLTIMQTDED